MVKTSPFKTPLSLFLIVIAALQLEAKTFQYVLAKKSWPDAQQHCKEKFTALASGRGQREELMSAFVKSGARSVWIGLYRDPGDAVWRWTGERSDASSDTNWARGEPEMRNCTHVDLSDRMWYNRKCSESWHSYCSKGDHVLHEIRALSWLDAQESCKKKSMVLPTVTQSNNNKFTHGWIGLHMPSTTSGSDTSKDIWQWIENDSDFRKWAPGEPNHDDCGYLSSSTDEWHSARCSDQLPFICVHDNDNMILVKEKKTWEEALEHCRAIGSVDSSQHNHYRDHQYDLVSLQSDDDHRYARDKIQEATTNEVWTALRFLAGKWLWVDGEPQQYQNLPLCPARGRRCGTLPKDHTIQWETRDCMERRNFLCTKSTAKQTVD